MSLLLHAYLLERYGVRMTVRDMARELEIAENTIFNKIAAGNFPVATSIDMGKRVCDVRDFAAYLDTVRPRENHANQS